MNGQQASYLSRPNLQRQSARSLAIGFRQLHAISPPPGHSAVPTAIATQANDASQTPKTPLSLLPPSNLLRSYAITALSSYPLLLTPSLRVLSSLAHSSSPFLNPDRNPLLHFLLKRTFYAQFCAGETIREVQKTAQDLKLLGFKGVILAYGKEIVLERGEKLDLGSTSLSDKVDEASKNAITEVQGWKKGTMDTIEMTEPGDFVALKFSGAGKDVMRQLAANSSPGNDIEQATNDICELSKARRVRLLFDAEQNAVQEGIDAWTLHFQEKYNIGKAVIYGTYQAYLKSTPAVLAQHVAVAERRGFVLGVKLVRGAYMASDPRSIFWETKEETDKAYDGIAEALMRRKWNSVLQCPKASIAFPNVNIVLASHNKESVEKAMAIRRDQTMKGEAKIEMAYGQLMGMADEVSCDLVLNRNKNKSLSPPGAANDVGPNAYKYLVWGSVGECLKYLVRRAEENRDAVLRAKGSRMALRAEVLRRICTWGK